MTAAAIETHDLTKRYGPIRALERLSLRVEPGEIFGFLGPNGAGKTTTIRLLLGLIAPTAGRAQVLGFDTATGSTWRQDVGYLPGALALWPSLSGARTLDMLADLTGRPPVWRAEFLERLQLSDADLARRVGAYSDGMRQKLGIVQALQCAPRLVLLDEPSKGLDPLIQVAFYDLLFEVAKRHTTVFFSSHVLPEVERVCHRVAMLRAGALVSIGDVDSLRRALPRRVTVVFRDDSPAVDVAEFGRVVEQSGRRVVLLVGVDRIPALAGRLSTMPIADLLIEPQGLEDAFLEQYPMIDRRHAALVVRLWRQHRVALLTMAAGLAVFEFVITRIAPAPGEAGFLAGILALMPPQVSAFASDELALASPRGVIAFGYLHPFFLALYSAWTIRVTSGALAGEIGRGTMDLLAARPVPRFALVLAAWVVMAGGLIVLGAAAWAGSAVGLSLRSLEVTPVEIVALPAMAWLLFTGWGGIALVVGATRREAGPVIAWASGLIATSFVLDFLARVWTPVQGLRPLSLFTYYRPAEIAQAGVSPGDAAVLAGVAIIGIATAVLLFGRRDL